MCVLNVFPKIAQHVRRQSVKNIWLNNLIFWRTYVINLQTGWSATVTTPKWLWDWRGIMPLWVWFYTFCINRYFVKFFNWGCCNFFSDAFRKVQQICCSPYIFQHLFELFFSFKSIIVYCFIATLKYWLLVPAELILRYLTLRLFGSWADSGWDKPSQRGWLELRPNVLYEALLFERATLCCRLLPSLGVCRTFWLWHRCKREGVIILLNTCILSFYTLGSGPWILPSNLFRKYRLMVRTLPAFAKWADSSVVCSILYKIAPFAQALRAYRGWNSRSSAICFGLKYWDLVCR